MFKKNNPYIEKVLHHSYIVHDPIDIYAHKGIWNSYFKNSLPLRLEIGTGMGNNFGFLAQKCDSYNLIGMEIRYKRLYFSAEKALKTGYTNLVVLKEFAQKIPDIFAPQEIAETYIYFPDPWANKQKQLKNRLMQTDFLKDLFEVTAPGGKVYFKTDHLEYFNSSLKIISDQGLWSIEKYVMNFDESKEYNTSEITEFEALYRGEDTRIHIFTLVKDL